MPRSKTHSTNFMLEERQIKTYKIQIRSWKAGLWWKVCRKYQTHLLQPSTAGGKTSLQVYLCIVYYFVQIITTLLNLLYIS